LKEAANHAKKGWQSNKTLAGIFMTTDRSIKRNVSKSKKYLHIKHPKGYYKTIWVKFHPDVQKLARVGTKMSQGEDKNGTSTRPKMSHYLYKY
jgi:hypothetical protein